MEIRDVDNDALVQNVTVTDKPAFLGRGLKPATGYVVSVFAVNSRGRSDRLNFHVFTAAHGENGLNGGGRSGGGGTAGRKAKDFLDLQTNESALTNSSEFEEKKLLKTLAIVGISLCFVLAVLAAVVCLRRVRKSFLIRQPGAAAVPAKGLNSGGGGGSGGRRESGGKAEEVGMVETRVTGKNLFLEFFHHYFISWF